MSKRWIWIVSLVCCVAMAGTALAERAEMDLAAIKAMSKADRQAYKATLEAAISQSNWNGKFNPVGRESAAPPKGIGAIIYDSGALGAAGQSSYSVGNQFDSAINPLGGGGVEPIEVSGSITMVTFDMLSVSGSAAFLSFFDQLAGTTANGISSFNTSAATGFNQKTVGVPYVGGTVLAGVWQIGDVTAITGDIPAVATGTVGWQGYHAMEIDDISGIDFKTLGNLNAVFRIQGDVLTPVELLNFDVE